MLKEYLLQTQKNFLLKENIWANSIFRDFIFLSCDKRGELGELWFSKWINNANLKVNEDKTNKNIKTKGHYDFMVNNKRIEIKTAYRGKTNTWQHENIYKKDVCDTNIFIDVDIDCIYLSVVYRNEIPFEYNSFFGNRKKATLRSGKIDGYKLDFSKVQIKLLMEKGRTLKINPNTTSDKDISKFLEKLLN